MSASHPERKGENMKAEYAPDNAIYVIALRSAGPKNGKEVQAALESIRDLVDLVCPAQVVAHRADANFCTHHDAMRRLGFDFDAANSIFTVASESRA